MVDYNGIAASVQVGAEAIPADQVEKVQSVEGKKYLPLTHEKYAGIGAQKGYEQKSNRIKKTRYNHDAMIDAILADPTLSQGALAKQFGVTEAWISTVYGSDAFQAALAKRRDDVLDPEVISSIEDRIKGLAHQSLNVIQEKLESTRNADLAIKGLEIASKALGFGARAAGPGQTNQFIIQLPPKAQSAEEWHNSHSPMKQLPPSESVSNG